MQHITYSEPQRRSQLLSGRFSGQATASGTRVAHVGRCHVPTVLGNSLTASTYEGVGKAEHVSTPVTRILQLSFKTQSEEGRRVIALVEIAESPNAQEGGSAFGISGRGGRCAGSRSERVLPFD